MSSVILNCRVASASIQFYDIFFLVMVEPQRMVIKCCQEKVMSVDGQVSELRILLLQIPLLYLCKALCFKIRRWRTRCHDTRGGIPLVDSGLVFFFFFNVGPPKESIFLTTFYGLYFSHHLHIYRQSPVKSPDIKTL